MKKILDYQKLDAKLLQLKSKLEGSKEHEVLKEMAAVYKDMQSKLFEIENKSESIKKDYDQTLQEYEKSIAKSKELSSQKVESFKDEMLNEELDKANKISSQLFMLERKLNIILTTINNTLKEFETTKNRALAAKNKHAEAKVRLENLQKETQPKIDALEKDLKKLEADLNADVFKKYKSLKNEKIFPVFVPLLDKNCGYCRVEMSNLKLDTLKDQPYIVCEQCGRLILSE